MTSSPKSVLVPEGFCFFQPNIFIKLCCISTVEEIVDEKNPSFKSQIILNNILAGSEVPSFLLQETVDEVLAEMETAKHKNARYVNITLSSD